MERTKQGKKTEENKPGASGAPGPEKHTSIKKPNGRNLANGNGSTPTIASGEPGSEGKSTKKGGEKWFDRFVNIYYAMLTPAMVPHMEPFHVQLGVIQDDAQNRAPVLIGKDNVVKHLGPRAVADYILQYCLDINHAARMPMTPPYARQAAEFFLSRAPVIQETHITPVAQKSDKGLCWHRLPWDLPKTPGPSPTFDEMLSRMDHPELVMAWVGSLLDAKADREQYLWIHGEGLDGKSRFANFLHRVMGPAARAENVPTTQERRFWASGLRGKRLVVFGDCDNGKFAGDGFFKRLTGDDPVRIEEKGVNAMDARLVAKFLFHGNVRPKIGTSRADLRRALIVEMRPVQGAVCATRTYDEKLWDEGAHFLARCIAEYRRVCPDGGKIPLSGEARDRVLELAEMNEEVWSPAMSLFRLVPVDTGQIIRDRPHITPAGLSERLQDALRWPDHKVQDFKEYLRRKHGIISRPVKLEGGVVERRYIGIVSNREERAPGHGESGC